MWARIVHNVRQFDSHLSDFHGTAIECVTELIHLFND
jgi:hypothetical protein